MSVSRTLSTADIPAKAVAAVLLVVLAVAASLAHGWIGSMRAAGPMTAVLTVDAPREGSLLFLHGLAGHGDLTVRGWRPGRCHALPVAFVAGDFGGNDISIRTGAPVRLAIRDGAVIRALLRGDEVVSDSVRVGPRGDRSADIAVLSGLTPNTGFVIDASRGFWSDIFGPRLREVACRQGRGAWTRGPAARGDARARQ